MVNNFSLKDIPSEMPGTSWEVDYASFESII